MITPEILTEKIIVADLGAGWGRIGYILKQINPKITYAIFDLPEPLLVAYTCLSSQLDEKILPYQDLRLKKTYTQDMLKEYGLIFGGPQDILRFKDKSIDIFINVASFQEMTKSQVDKYLDIIDQKVNGTLFIQQYYSHPDLNRLFGTIKGLEEYNFNPSWEKIYIRNSIFSERYFEAAFNI
jgi:putative sugar O-methyltransferase